MEPAIRAEQATRLDSGERVSPKPKGLAELARAEVAFCKPHSCRIIVQIAASGLSFIHSFQVYEAGKTRYLDSHGPTLLPPFLIAPAYRLSVDLEQEASLSFRLEPRFTLSQIPYRTPDDSSVLRCLGHKQTNPPLPHALGTRDWQLLARKDGRWLCQSKLPSRATMRQCAVVLTDKPGTKTHSTSTVLQRLDRFPFLRLVWPNNVIDIASFP
ncbi:unnamed protein product [Protopolystoma xenopodis]|uniref:Uncharacterized protein n=1 Tax=Protopolystoma xenopodis TaxID=117903 RepID=A0A3S5AF60_9PLAT|nr:unnamed protein product [Protopolystoma xenopodis]